jgi:RNA polymerase sigma-70 factor (ECF subfamily)
MSLVKTGNTSAFETLFARYKRPLYGYLRRMVSRSELADELFQETFLNVHRFRSSWDIQLGSFRGWLYRIATNLMRDRLRSQGRKPEVLVIEDRPVEGTEAAGDLALRLELEHALEKLPDTLKDAFYLGAMEGLDHHEVALALSITPDNARARISRARTRLRELLEVA